MSLSRLFDEDFPNIDWLKILGPRSDGPKTIENDALAKLPNLLSFSFVKMPLARLKPFAFRSNKQLKSIEIILCRLRSLPSRIFQDLAHLERVDFSSNEIVYLSDSLFSNNSKLVEIDFSRNRIKMMTTGLFDNLSSLLTIDFRFNQILALSKSDLFQNNKKLEGADFSHNRIRKISPDFLKDRGNIFNVRGNPCYQKNLDLEICIQNWEETRNAVGKQGTSNFCLS